MSKAEKIAEEQRRRGNRVVFAMRVWAAAQRHRVAVSLVLFVWALGSVFYWDELASRGLPRNAFVLGQELSHVGIEPARRRLEPLSRARNQRPIELEIDGKRSTLVPEPAGLRVDVPGTLTALLEERRSRGFFQRFWLWLEALLRKKREARLRVQLDSARLDAELDRVERESLTLPFVGGFRVEAGRVVPDYPRAGRRLSRADAKKRLLATFSEGNARVVLPTEAASVAVPREAVDALVAEISKLTSAPIVLGNDASQTLELETEDLLRTIEVVPESLTTRVEVRINPEILARVLGDRLTRLESEAKPARFVIDAKDQVELVPSQAQQRLDPRLVAASVLEAARSPQRHAGLPFSSGEEPELTTEAARALSIRGLVSSFTTRHPCCERRVENIHRIAELLDNLLVKPGETVSVNAVVGPRTKKNGFVLAPSIEEGEFVETLGGGISQFATTLFNALFHGGYDIIERQPHTYWFPRYPMGHEATLSFPKPDLIFRNDTAAGLLIDTLYTKTRISVRLFGDNGGRKIEAQVSARQNLVDPPVEIVGNASVPPDREHTATAGMIGWSVIVGRIVRFPDGTKREERRKVTYRPKPRRVEVHPCRVPRGEPGYSAEPCPEPEPDAEATPENIVD